MNLHGGHADLRPPAGSQPAAQVEQAPGSSGGQLTMSVLALVCAASVIAAGWWSLAAPLQSLPPSSSVHPSATVPRAPSPKSSRSEDPAPPLLPLDLAAFRIPLWVAPHRPVPTSATAPAQATAAADSASPLRWQLLAIIGDGDTSKAGGGGPARAMIYDPDDDRVYDFSVGAERAGKAIQSIAAGRVIVTRGDNSYTLSLDGPVVLQRGGR